MRRIPWMCFMMHILDVYKNDIKYGDQDLLNIFFYFQPFAFYTLPCSFNYRTDNCPFNCTDVQRNGVAILHANRDILIKDNMQHPFKNVFEVIASVNLTNFNATALSNEIRFAALSHKPKDRKDDKDIACRTPDSFITGLLTLTSDELPVLPGQLKLTRI